MTGVRTVSLVFLSTILATVIAFDQPHFLEQAVDSDLVVPASFFWDLVHRAGAWGEFQLPRIPSFFPDLTVYGLVQLATGSWRVAYFAYGLVALTALAWLAGWIVDAQTNSGTPRGAAAFLVLALPILGIELLPAAPAEAAIHSWIFLPVSHGGVFVLSLAGFAVAAASLRRRGAPWLLLLLPLTIAGVLGDLLFVAGFVGPLLAALAFAGWRRMVPPRRIVAVALVVLAAIPLALAADSLILREPTFVLLKGREIVADAIAFLTSPFYPLGVEAPFAVLAGLGLPIAGLIVARPPLAMLRRRRDAAEEFEAAGFWWVAAVSAVICSAVATAPVYYESVRSYRYTEPLLWWPVIITAALLAKRGRSLPTLALGALTVLAAFVAVRPAGLHWPAILTWRDPLAACLVDAQDRQGLRAGLGQYPFANYLFAASDGRLQVEEIHDNEGGAYRDLNDLYWYWHDRHDPSRPPPFNFIVVTPHPDAAALAAARTRFGRGAKAYWQRHVNLGLKPALLRQLYGEPDRILECPGSLGITRQVSAWTDIWIYDRPGMLYDRLIDASPIVWPSLFAAHRSICLSPRHLHSPGGVNTGDAITARLGPSGGVGTFGPYVDLPPGRYAISLAYRLTAPTPGRWSVTTDAGARQWFSGALPPSSADRSDIVADIDFPQGAQRMEVVTSLPGAGDIRVDGIGIAPEGAQDGPTPCARQAP
jgi:hypothetical protein